MLLPSDVVLKVSIVYEEGKEELLVNILGVDNHVEPMWLGINYIGNTFIKFLSY